MEIYEHKCHYQHKVSLERFYGVFVRWYVWANKKHTHTTSRRQIDSKTSTYKTKSARRTIYCMYSAVCCWMTVLVFMFQLFISFFVWKAQQFFMKSGQSVSCFGSWTDCVLICYVFFNVFASFYFILFQDFHYAARNRKRTPTHKHALATHTHTHTHTPINARVSHGVAPYWKWRALCSFKA